MHVTSAPQTPSAYVVLGLAYLDQNDLSRAQTKLLHAYAISPRSVEVLDALGYYYERTDNLAEAKRYYQTALTGEGDQASAENNYGRFLCRIQQYAEGQRYLLHAAYNVQYPHRSMAFENAGWCALSAGDCVHAIRYFEQALQQDPNNLSARTALRKCSVSSGVLGSKPLR